MKKMKFLALCLAAVLLLAACGGQKTEETTVPETTEVTETTVSETTAAATEAVTLPPETEDHLISTPYGDLHFPGDWAPFLKTETTEDPYTVTFYAVLDTREEPQKLFAVTFGGKTEEAVAALKTADGYAAVAVQQESFVPDDTWSDRDINIVFTMQEAMNTVLDNLPLEDVSVLAPAQQTTTSAGSGNQETVPGSAELPENIKDDMAIDTPYMELHYPSKWADNLSIKVNEDSVYSVGYYCSIGSHGEVHLFTVYFGGQSGASLKTIKAEDGEMVEIRIDVPELSLDDSWTGEEKSTAYAMQEDLNYLLGKMS